MEYEFLKESIVDNNILIVTIDRQKALNALNAQLIDELNAYFTELENRDEISVVIVTGAGRAFVAGADIVTMSELNAYQGAAWGKKGMDTFLKVEKLNKPVIAAVNGFALGGGCELSLACDLRIASNKAKFGQPEVGLGITPGFGGTQRLARAIGPAKAKELIYTAEVISAEEAYEIGLVNKVVEHEELMDAAIEMARKIAKNSAVAVRYAKDAINTGLQTDIDSGMDIERAHFGLCFATADQKEGMKAFIEKRAPKFIGE